MSITVIYVECKAQRGGDYASAAEFAFALQRRLSGTGNRCVLASSVEGIKKLKQLYGKPSSDQLSIHGLIIDVIVLEQFAEQEKKEKVSHYVELAACKLAPASVVRKAISSTTSLVFLGLALNNPTNFANIQYYRFQQEFKLGKASQFCLGFGPNRMGVTVYNGSFAELKHDDYYQVTKQNFGFCYFDSREKNADYFVRDYLRITHQTFKTNNYIFIGDHVKSEKGIQYFITSSLMNSKQRINIFNLISNHVIIFSPKQHAAIYDVQIEALKDSDHAGDSDINFLLLSHTSNEQMRSLMKAAITFIGVAGMASTIESIAFGKIAFIQYIANNNLFLDSYHQELKEHSGLKQLTWMDKRDAIDEVIAYLNDETWRQQLVERNTALMEKSQISHKIWEKLGCPDKKQTKHSTPQVKSLFFFHEKLTPSKSTDTRKLATEKTRNAMFKSILQQIEFEREAAEQQMTAGLGIL